jgi:GNAT superfamily N-acetyltransferase
LEQVSEVFSAVEQETQQETGIRVRRARLTDYPAIGAFLREAYGELAPFKEGRRWAWQFVDNPYAKREDNDVPVWIAETDGRVVGQIAVQKGALKLDGATHPAGWIVDVIILPAYRGLGLGHQLLAAVARECPILVTLTMAAATRRLTERLGAVGLGEVKLYWRGARLDPATVQRYLLARTAYHPYINSTIRSLCCRVLLHRILASAGNFLLSLRNHFTSLPRGREEISIVQTQRFGPDIDVFWKQVSRDFPVAFARETEFLNWRFCECPQMRYHCFVASRDGRPVGYLVLRRTESVELPQGIIVDLMASPKDSNTIKALVAFAVNFFGNDVSAVQCATSVSEFSDVLRKFGFYSVRRERPNCVVADDAIRKRLERSSSDWLLSKADHDWDQIHLA